MPKLRDIEKVIADNADQWLQWITSHGYQSHTVTVYKVIKNVQTKVYGRESEQEGQHKVAEIECVLVGDDFFPQDAAAAGTFQEGWMYTISTQVNVGDRVEVTRPGNEGKRRYQVNAIHKLGTSKIVFKKFRLSALGD